MIVSIRCKTDSETNFWTIEMKAYEVLFGTGPIFTSGSFSRSCRLWLAQNGHRFGTDYWSSGALTIGRNRL